MKYTSDQSIQVSDFKRFNRPFVYGWSRNGNYLYIGLTRRGLSRLLNYHTVIGIVEPLLDTNFFDLWFCPPSELAALEQELIAIHQPKYNAYDLRQISRYYERTSPPERPG